ncbi:acetyltransferase [Pseudomonas saudiphocaensis]|uniref:Hexapeptide repeat-containing transferase n=1 Tax=Pseudomonas saudiphocaensis TaxID=1499686 RepID=A0A078LQ16_9PSED|nr:acetyltransferase [Pseudomonas saudiphocaensis]CDZ94618.1 hexapeptide repeat-containing transferase [Pseudomonas saudiphocaensis]
MSRLAILGASGHGKVVADTAECCGWTTVEFFDDAWPGQKKNDMWQVVGDTAALMERLANFDGVVVAIGNNRIRHAKLLELQAAGARLVTLVHPAATVSRYVSIGKGTVVFAGAVVNAGACINPGSILNTGCSVDHDCLLGDAVHISPGARLAGGVQVGDLSWIGIGASVRQLIRIGQRVMVGAGAAVIGDIPNDVTVAGVPAKRMR